MLEGLPQVFSKGLLNKVVLQQYGKICHGTKLKNLKDIILKSGKLFKFVVLSTIIKIIVLKIDSCILLFSFQFLSKTDVPEC